MKRVKKIAVSVEAVRCLVADCENGLQNATVGGNALAGEKLILKADRQDRKRNECALPLVAKELVWFYREGRAALSGSA